jgi:hypothetical protein
LLTFLGHDGSLLLNGQRLLLPVDIAFVGGGIAAAIRFGGCRSRSVPRQQARRRLEFSFGGYASGLQEVIWLLLWTFGLLPDLTVEFGLLGATLGLGDFGGRWFCRDWFG